MKPNTIFDTYNLPTKLAYIILQRWVNAYTPATHHQLSFAEEPLP